MVGSVKFNVGHLECAAGIAGLIKAILVLQHETVPSNVCLKKMNPHIEKIFDSHNPVLRFPTELEKLRLNSTKVDDTLLVAGVSSFGYSGTIAHAIIQQAPKNSRRKMEFYHPEKNSTGGVHNKNILYLFTGQGSQNSEMGQELY